MKENYGLFYSYKNIGDVLIVIFDNLSWPTKSVRIKNVEVIYHDENIIGYNIFNVMDMVKIKTSGIIYQPNDALIDVINCVLKNAKLETLAYKNKHSYVTGKVIDVIPLDNQKTFVISDISSYPINSIVKNTSLQVGDHVVIALPGCYLNNGDLVVESSYEGQLINGHICSLADLDMGDNNLLIIDKEIEIGKDFFTMEVK